MATITSAASGAANVGGTWVGGVAPGAGDDVIIAGHTIDFPVDVTYQSLMLNNVASRMTISGGGTRTITVNGYILRSAALSGVCITVSSGTNLRLLGTHSATANQAQYFLSVNGGTVTLEGNGGGSGSLLLDSVSTERFLITSGAANTITLLGRIQNLGSGNSLFVTISHGGTYSWTWTGLSIFNGAATSKLWNHSPGASVSTLTISGNLEIGVAASTTAILIFSGSTTSVTVTSDLTSTLSTTSGAAVVSIANCDVTWSGKICHPAGTNSLTVIMSSGAFHYGGQSLTYSATESFTLYSTAGTLDFGDLTVNTSATFVCLLVGTTSYAIGSGVTFIADVPGAVIGINYMPVNIVYIESDPATLPAVEDVAAGEVYGYTGIELTGTGLIVDPAVLAAAMLTSFSSLPEVLVSTTIATLASQTSFTLTTGSSDNDAYNDKTLIVTDATTAVQKCTATVLDYDGATKTITLAADPAIFTIAAGDKAVIIAGASGGGGDPFPAEAPAGWIKSASVEDGTITAAKFAAGAITSTVVADNAITAAKIASNAITSAKIAASAIGASQIASNAITSAKIAAGALDSVWTTATRSLTTFGTLVADIWAHATRTITGAVTLAAAQPDYTPAKAGDAMTLTAGERTAVANEVEAQIIDEADPEKVLQAIVDKIAQANPDLSGLTLAAIASAIRTELTTELARIDAAVSSRADQTSVDAVAGYVDTEMAAAKAAAESAAASAAVAVTQTTAAAQRAAVGLAAANLDAQLTSISNDTGSLLANLAALAAKFTGITFIGRWLSTLFGKTADASTLAEIQAMPGGTTFDNALHSPEAIRDRGDVAWITAAGGSTGARTITVVVQDADTNPIENAVVRISAGVLSFVQATNVNGEAVFNLDDGTYLLAITKAAYSFAGVSLVVSADATETYTMTAIVIVPGSGDATTAYLTLLDDDEQPAAGATLYWQLIALPSGSSGTGHIGVERSSLSNGSGLVTFPALRGGRYLIWRRRRPSAGNGVLIPADAGATYELPSVLGSV